jgi:hypothetical protein
MASSDVTLTQAENAQRSPESFVMSGSKSATKPTASKIGL